MSSYFELDTESYIMGEMGTYTTYNPNNMIYR